MELEPTAMEEKSVEQSRDAGVAGGSGGDQNSGRGEMAVGYKKQGEETITFDQEPKKDSVERFSGLGKQELMKIAYEPFWVKMRWFLFILFWVGWLAMLGGAVGIILQAERC